MSKFFYELFVLCKITFPYGFKLLEALLSIFRTSLKSEAKQNGARLLSGFSPNGLRPKLEDDGLEVVSLDTPGRNLDLPVPLSRDTQPAILLNSLSLRRRSHRSYRLASLTGNVDRLLSVQERFRGPCYIACPQKTGSGRRYGRAVPLPVVRHRTRPTCPGRTRHTLR